MRTVNPPASCVRRFESDPYHHSSHKDCSQWIATGYALAMTTLYFASMRGCGRAEVLHASVIARNNVTRQSIVARRTRTESAVRLPVHSGSPRAFSPRDDNTLYFATDESDAVHHDSVIARRTLVRRGNPSCLEGRVRRVRFVYWFTVDRHGHFLIPSR